MALSVISTELSRKMPYYTFWKYLKKKHPFVKGANTDLLGYFSSKLDSISDTQLKVLSLLAIVLAFLFMIIQLPKIQAQNAYELSHILFSEIPSYEDDFRKTLAQILGGVILLIGLYLTNKRIRASEKQAESALAQVEISRKSQEVESFSRAVEQLASKEFYNQLGGLSSIEELAKSSEIYSKKLILILESILKIETNKKDDKNKELINVSLNLLNKFDQYKGDKFSIDLRGIYGGDLNLSIHSTKRIHLRLSTSERPSSISVSTNDNTTVHLSGSFAHTYLNCSIQSWFTKFENISFGNIYRSDSLDFNSSLIQGCRIESCNHIYLNNCIIKESDLSNVTSENAFKNVLSVYKCKLNKKIEDFLVGEFSKDIFSEKRYQEATEKLDL
ncbi:hypothetical protein [Gracilimonas sp.]|uniref:hypothetical protein n=1 Tax=Gracilimonas sp. TaxID=1974203 RepID=UPI003BAAADED